MNGSSIITNHVASLYQSLAFINEVQKFLDKELIVDSNQANIVDRVIYKIDDETLQGRSKYSNFGDYVIKDLAKQIADKIRDVDVKIGDYYRFASVRYPKLGITEFSVSYLTDV